jgi:hypothetical protein
LSADRKKGRVGSMPGTTACAQSLVRFKLTVYVPPKYSHPIIETQNYQ